MSCWSCGSSSFFIGDDKLERCVDCNAAQSSEERIVPQREAAPAAKHTLMMTEQKFSTGTWGGSLLTGFTLKCGNCKCHCCVSRDVVALGSSIYNAKGCRDLTCPYCATTAQVELDNRGRILEDNRSYGDD